MKKIPTLFTRVFENRRIVDIKDEITPGCEDAFLNGIATVKIDGSCCAIINGELFKRYDAKKGKKPPVGAIPCCDPDPVTGHWPHWVQVDYSNPSDKWFVRAADNTPVLSDGTYEAIGPHFNGNPYGLCDDILEPHGVKKIDVIRDFDHIKAYLEDNYIEGLVFWLDGEPVCKIKRSDFGLPWSK
ncbi:MAG: hypothetical protein IKW20_05825 [Bacteroidales bacterium]|nr:hypothetical protein [Bacteroidales bacterium]